jgi:uncharacterized DUF497 family protein
LAIRYEWDEVKNRSNVIKHGLDFADAEEVLSGPRVTFVDDHFGQLVGRVVVIAHALRGDDTTRIVSMRKGNRREQKIYAKRLGEA